MTRRLQDVLARLRERDYKLTPQRQVVVQAFIDYKEEHLSAEDVYNIVKAEHPEIGLATIYRTLDLLSELDIIERIDFGDGRTRYEFTEEEAHHHHHLICQKCGKVEEFGQDLLDDLENLIAHQNGFTILDHQLKFYGICKTCSSEAANGSNGTNGSKDDADRRKGK